MVKITPVLNGVPLSKFKRDVRLVDGPEAAERTILHGISPIFVFKEKPDYVYPVYSTESMREAQHMNRIAIMQAKHPVKYTYPKATEEDLVRLTSEDSEYTSSRVTWTNPKDGKVYHILKERTTENGSIIVRILDKYGVFVKEAEIKPKNILVIDDFSEFSMPRLCSLIRKNPSHGDFVCKFIRKYNPFANIEIATKPYNFAEELISRISKGEIFDYVNISYGPSMPRDNISKLAESSNKKGFAPECWDELDKLLEENNIRVVFSSGNGRKNCTNYYLSLNNVEGCGSIDSNGKISEFSSSRDSKYTQHYEQGNFKLKVEKNGLKILGPDIVIPYDKGCDKVGKKLKDVITELRKENSDEELAFIKYFDIKSGVSYMVDTDGKLIPFLINDDFWGTSFAAPTRTAKLALNDMMKDVL